MEELVLNNRRLKLVDGEIWSWKLTKNPYWRKVKYTIKKDGYYTLNLKYNTIQKNYLVHRLIYKFSNPDWDIHDSSSDNQVDHIDNCRNNNNIENLRIVNNSENQQNRPLTKGYTWSKTSQKYRSLIKVNNKLIHLGYYDTIDEAREAYLIGKEKYHTH
jgi:hypothetical protein